MNTQEKRGVLTSLSLFFNRRRLGELLVHKGYISPLELKHALHEQKNSSRPLGHILIDMEKITKSQLSRILFKQKALQFSAAALCYFASFGSFAKKSYAGDIADIPARIMLASVDGEAISDLTRYPKLFNASEKRSTNLKAFTKWSSMFDRFERSLRSSEGQKVINALKDELAGISSSSVYQMARDVNALMNKKKYIVDSKNWGKSDYWATPVEFLTRGGDCEDFAIAKYTALRALGVPENRLRIAIVQDQKKNMPHAVLVVYSEKGPMILDNQIKEMRSASNISHYKPIFSINREAWWLHTAPTGQETTVIAAAE